MEGSGYGFSPGQTARDRHIRRATIDDAHAIADLHIRVWQWAYRGLLPQDFLDRLTDTMPRREAFRHDMLAHTEGAQRTWVAVVSDSIAAFADTGPSRDADAAADTGELYSLYVDEAVSRQGIGRALLSHAIEDLRRRGFSSITLWVLDTNGRARRFYEALGWQLDGATKTDPRPGNVELHEVRYRLDM